MSLRAEPVFHSNVTSSLPSAHTINDNFNPDLFQRCAYVELNVTVLDTVPHWRGDSLFRARAWVDMDGDGRFSRKDEEVSLGRRVYIGDQLSVNPRGLFFHIRYHMPADVDYSVAVKCNGDVVHQSRKRNGSHYFGWLLGVMSFSGENFS